MATWLGMDGKTYHEIEIGNYPTELAAIAAAEKFGAVVRKQKISGVSLSGNGRSFRVSRSSWLADHFTLWESKEKLE